MRGLGSGNGCALGIQLHPCTGICIRKQEVVKNLNGPGRCDPNTVVRVPSRPNPMLSGVFGRQSSTVHFLALQHEPPSPPGYSEQSSDHPLRTSRSFI